MENELKPVEDQTPEVVPAAPVEAVQTEEIVKPAEVAKEEPKAELPGGCIASY